jgi:hypothetical protein
VSGLDLDVFLYWGSLGLAAAAVLLFLWFVASGDEPDVLSKRENRREVAVSDAVYRPFVSYPERRARVLGRLLRILRAGNFSELHFRGLPGPQSHRHPQRPACGERP